MQLQHKTCAKIYANKVKQLLGVETVPGVRENGHHELLMEFLPVLWVCYMHVLLNGGHAFMPCLQIRRLMKYLECK